MAKLTKQAFVDALKEMSLLEIKELVDGLKEEFGIDPSAVAVASGPAAAAEVEEKTEFNVILKSFGDKKIEVIKVARAATGLGLVDAKKLVETADAVIKENVKKDEADKLKADFEAAGAVIEIA
ncbi:MAG: 50S ribosomal protein L7/L12 [Acholeplasma sp.]